jgi:chorismate synthase
MLKYGFDDARDVLERASARETAARVAAGSLAKLLLSHLGMTVVSHIVGLGEATTSPESPRPGPGDLDRVDDNSVRCFDPVAAAAMVAAVKAAAKEGDSLGGVAEVLAYGVPVGLGSHVHWDRKLDALLAQALMSIQAVKAVEIGEGWENAARRGSEAHDAIRYDPDEGYVRPTDRAGGIEGGISNGALLVARVAMKPLATLNRPVLETVDVVSKESTISFRERTDVTAVPAMGVVAETMTALVLTRWPRSCGTGMASSPPWGAHRLLRWGGSSTTRDRSGCVGADLAGRHDGCGEDDGGEVGRREARLGLSRLRCRSGEDDRADRARDLCPGRRGGVSGGRSRRTAAGVRLG